MMPRKAIKFWLPAFALVTMVSWYGCEQKGDISPTGSGRSVLTFIDSLGVSPNPISPGDTATVVAQILAETMEPDSGEDVRFSVTRGTLGSGTGEATVRTDGSGFARTTFTAPQDTGSVLVRAELLSMSEMRTTTVHVSSAPANEGLLSVWADADSLFADNGVSSTRIYARLRNATNNPIGGATIYFSTNLGTVVSPAITNDTTGVAQTTLVSTTETGRAIIIARYDATTDTVNVVFLAPYPASSISLTVEPDVLEANGTSQASLRAWVLDARNQPISDGTLVTFTSEYGVITAGQQPQVRPGKDHGKLESAWTTALDRHEKLSVATSPKGRLDVAASGKEMSDRRNGLDEATSTYTTSTTDGYAYATLTSSTTVAIDHIVASVDTLSDTKTVTYVAGSAASLVLSAQSDTLRADGIAVDSITAHVTDGAGHELANVEVQFSATIGNITVSRVTDANGDAKVPFTSSQTGIAHITATAGTAEDSYTIYLIPGLPNSILLSYFPNFVSVQGSGRNETLLITALVRDASNNPVLDGTGVDFEIYLSPPGGGDSLSADWAPTINGEASVSYSSGTRSGSVRIRAAWAVDSVDVSAISTEILIYAGPAYIENILDGCLTSHMTIFPTPMACTTLGDSVLVTVLVGDRWNNPVTPGTAVYFTASAGVITTSPGHVDSTGHASVWFYPGNPLPTIDRWLNTLPDPNIGGPILCNPIPQADGVAKILASSAGATSDSFPAWVWATADVQFKSPTSPTPTLEIREVSVNGDPSVRDLYIGETAEITVAVYGQHFWPLVDGSLITFSADAGLIYPEQIPIGCPGDTSYTVSFFNNLTVQDEDVTTPVLVVVDQDAAYAFTEALTLHAALPPDSVGGPRRSATNLNGN